MKKEARYKLNAKSQKSGFFEVGKISRILKTDFLTIYHTSASFSCHQKFSAFQYTFIAKSVHFHYHAVPPLSILNEQLYLAYCSFVRELRFKRSLLYLEVIAKLHFIQTYKCGKAISVTKIELFLEKGIIMNKNHRLGLITTVITQEEHYDRRN